MYSLVIFLSCLTTIFCTCSFFRTATWLNNRTWSGRLTKGYHEQNLEYIFKDETVLEKEYERNKIYLKDYICEKIINVDESSITVQLVMKGDTVKNCFKYEKLNSLVMKKSYGGNCNNLTMENSIYIDKDGLESAKRKPCTDIAEGGFKATLTYLKEYNIRRNSYTCKNPDVSSSINIECYSHAGLFIVPDELACLPEYYFFESIRFFCKISWMNSRYLFTIAEVSGNVKNKYWLIRTDPNPVKKIYGYSHSVILMRKFEEIVEKEPRNIDAIEFLMQQDSYVINHMDLCMDTFRVCQRDSNICRRNRKKCPKKCKICDRLKPNICLFDGRFTGNWKVNNYSVSLNESSIKTDTGDKFECVNFRQSNLTDNTRIKQYFVVSRKNNGCGPKYTCITFQTNSDNTILMKMGEPRDITLLYEHENGPVSCSANDCGSYCRSRKFDKGILRRGSFQPFFRETSTMERVRCDIPHHIRKAKNWTIENMVSANKENCFVNLSFENKMVLIETLSTCSFQLNLRLFCFGSFKTRGEGSVMQLISARENNEINMKSICVPNLDRQIEYYKFYLTDELDCLQAEFTSSYSFRYKPKKLTTTTVSTTQSTKQTTSLSSNHSNNNPSLTDIGAKNSTWIIEKFVQNPKFLAVTSIFGAFFQFFLTCQCFK